MLRENSVKDDSGANAVFIEQGSSMSQCGSDTVLSVWTVLDKIQERLDKKPQKLFVSHGSSLTAGYGR